jgi:hypothetical protein
VRPLVASDRIWPVRTRLIGAFVRRGSWGYAISIDGAALVKHAPATTCGPTETVTTGGSFQITDGQDVIFGSGDSSTTGYYFVYGFYSP